MLSTSKKRRIKKVASSPFFSPQRCSLTWKFGMTIQMRSAVQGFPQRKLTCCIFHCMFDGCKVHISTQVCWAWVLEYLYKFMISYCLPQCPKQYQWYSSQMLDLTVPCNESTTYPCKSCLCCVKCFKKKQQK